MLFRKSLPKTFNVVHDYSEATISIWILQKRGTKWEVLSNQFSNTHGIDRKLLANLTVDIKQLIKVPQLSTMTAKKPLIKLMRNSQQTKQGHALNVYKLRGGVTNPLEGSPIKKTAEPHSFNTSVSLRITQGEQRTALLGEEWSLIWLLDKAAGNSTAHPGTEQLDIPRAFEPTVLTRTVHSPTCSAKNSWNLPDSNPRMSWCDKGQIGIFIPGGVCWKPAYSSRVYRVWPDFFHWASPQDSGRIHWNNWNPVDSTATIII